MKLWYLAGALLVLAAVPLLWPTEEPKSRLAPYRFRLESKPAGDEVAALEEHVARTPEGLDLAALSRAYLMRARRTGQCRWIDAAESAARRSLDALPVSNPGATLAIAQAAQMRHDFAGSIELCD